MNDASNQTTTDDNLGMCQVDDKPKKPAKRERVRSGMSTVGYWKGKLFRNSYRAKDGSTIELPEFYVRLRHDGITRRVRLTNSDRELAADEALELFHRLGSEGWAAVTARQARLPASPTIDEFCETYRTATVSMEKAPRKISIATYARSLRQLCGLAGVKRIRELNREAIERGRDAYRAQARAAKRIDSAIQNSVAKVIRNAAACFSVEALAVMRRSGLALENPFLGIKRTQEIQPTSSLPQAVLDRIWADAAKLRDGDPCAADPMVEKFAKQYRKKHGHKVRWKPVDFRKPHPDAYAALMLALGAGLRANEIDKARWSWIKFGPNGECVLDVGEESDFRPKGGTRRMIRIPTTLHDAIVQARTDLDSPYVIGGEPSGKERVEGYRRPDTFRAVNSWIRARVGGRNTLHRLRKQFGSEVATAFGLFNAQKLLGHSSPTTTARYYAAQTALPELTHVKIMG